MLSDEPKCRPWIFPEPDVMGITDELCAEYPALDRDDTLKRVQAIFDDAKPIRGRFKPLKQD